MTNRLAAIQEELDLVENAIRIFGLTPTLAAEQKQLLIELDGAEGEEAILVKIAH
jgi:hypothetical protein